MIMLTLDGSIGEGGGQVLRTALALALVTGKPFRIEDILGGREKPGLLRQHLAAVNAAAVVSSAKVSGAAVGGTSLTFEPSRVRPGDYSFAIGSAGSTTLVLQTILPALSLADGPSTVTVEGGTHNTAAPPFDFLERAFVPLVNRMGPSVALTLHCAAFYPAGGGRFTATIQPSDSLSPLHLLERGEESRRCCTALVAALPGEIALRELDLVKRMMGWPEECFVIRRLPEEHGPGNVVMIEVASREVTEVFTAFGERGFRAEAVAEAVAEAALQQAKTYLAAGVPVGKHLADQLLVPLAISGGGSFLTMAPTPHATTAAEVVRTFLDVNISVTQNSRDRWLVEAGGAGAGSVANDDAGGLNPPS